MTMTGPTAAAERRAGTSAAEDTLLHQHRGATEIDSKKKRRFFRLPSHADGWSMLFAVMVMAFIPLWFFVVMPLWNPALPTQPWVWSLPWEICTYYIILQVLFLLASLSHSSDEIGMKDMAISGLTFVSALIVTIIMVMLWKFDKYVMDEFLWTQVRAILVGTLGELAITAWMRLVVNRRYFASVGGTGA